MTTVASKYFDYQFLATLYERGQGNPSGGDKGGGRKGCWCDQNYNIIKGWFHYALRLKFLYKYES